MSKILILYTAYKFYIYYDLYCKSREILRIIVKPFNMFFGF